MGMREQILQLSKEYSAKNGHRTIVPGRDYIPVSGKLLDENDLVTLIDSCLDMWFTAGRYCDRFEKEFAQFMGQKFCLLVNSGSSANLLALTTLTSHSLGERRLKPGDEVITVSAGFPTTINPIIQNGLIPVFVDIELGTYQIDVTQLEAARSSKTRAVMIAHTLGNVFDLAAVTEFCKKHDLFLIEDCCDAVGAKYQGKSVGTFGQLATTSFYPAHHITMGEGGSVLCNDGRIKRAAESFRDWGRDCWCPPGKDNTCGKRFGWTMGDLPAGYDHKYVYTHIGYNLKVTDMQGALGVAQLAKLPTFIRRRQENFAFLREALGSMQEHMILPVATANSEPSWFGFPITLKPSAKISRNEMVKYLEANKIGTRLVFGGNLLRQPLYRDIKCRAIGELPNADVVMNQSFWVGVHPTLQQDHLTYIAEKITAALI